MNTLALISGQSLVESLVILVVVGLIFWLCLWFIGWVALPEPFAKVAKVVLGLFALLFLIGFLLNLIGHPVIAW